MNFGESSGAGGSSSSGRENGAASPDDHRPHKKARFPWQIKGKHHLKNQPKLLTESPTVAPEELDTDASPSEPIVPSFVPSDDIPIENITSFSGNATKPPVWPENICILTGQPTPFSLSMPFDQVMAFTESMLREANLSPVRILHKPESEILFEREVRRLRRAEDMCISQWQDTQTQRSCFQNSLNTALEVLRNAPGSAEDRLLTHIHDLPPKIIENQAIMMAISVYGLQFPLTSSEALSEEFPMSWPDESPIYYGDSDSDYSICSEDSELANLRDSSSWTSNEDVTHQNWSATNDSVNLKSPQSEMPIQDDHLTTGDEEFIDSAVIEAIQSKGLMTAGIDFG